MAPQCHHSLLDAGQVPGPSQPSVLELQISSEFSNTTTLYHDVGVSTALWVGVTASMFSESNAAWYQDGLRITRLFNPHSSIVIMTQSQLFTQSHLHEPHAISTELSLLGNLTALNVNLRFSGKQRTQCENQLSSAGNILKEINATSSRK